jgi:uncharacterized membrane protein
LIASIHLKGFILSIGHWIGLMGVVVIVVGLIIAGALLQRDLARHEVTSEEMYRTCRQRVGRGLVLGLEVLVAADIIETVAIEPTFTSIGVLAMIVVVRTFLGWSLAVELEGRWPWQKEVKSCDDQIQVPRIT